MVRVHTWLCRGPVHALRGCGDRRTIRKRGTELTRIRPHDVVRSAGFGRAGAAGAGVELERGVLGTPRGPDLGGNPGTSCTMETRQGKGHTACYGTGHILQGSNIPILPGDWMSEWGGGALRHTHALFDAFGKCRSAVLMEA